MNRVAIWGTGQGGRMLLDLLRADMNVVAFCDNNRTLHGTTIKGVPVMNEEQIVELNPDHMYVAILNKEACVQVKEQIRSLGLQCRITLITEFREQFDVRLAVLRLIAKEIRDRDISGAVAELGVYRGAFAAEINRMFPDRKLYLFDTFDGFDARDIEIEKENRFSRYEQGKFGNTSMDNVREVLPHPEQALFRAGYFPDTALGLEEKFALVSLDADLYRPMYEGLHFFYPKLSKGGYIILHDYNSSQFLGAGEATKKFCRENDVHLVPLCDLHGSAVIVKP
ncbi:MAG TPA: TylF/MycF/NovP-related O-methyltransferase [Desulfomicrobiaceae bacterium]|nr:TylF/MycF/NovP-related O-methyltransferase [Desulfomicrobiaceae bacterium]